MSDRYGARRMACCGAILVATGSVIAGAAPAYALLLGGRALAGVGSALYVTAAMNVLARTTPVAHMARSMSIYQAAIMSGVAFGPSLGGLLAGLFNYRVPLYSHAALAVICASIAVLTLPARLPVVPLRGRGPTGSALGLLRDGAFASAVALSAVVFVIRAGVLSTLTPLFADHTLHLSTQVIGYALTVAAAVNLVVLPHAGNLSDRRHRKVAVLVGLSAGIAGYADTRGTG